MVTGALESLETLRMAATLGKLPRLRCSPELSVSVAWEAVELS